MPGEGGWFRYDYAPMKRRWLRITLAALGVLALFRVVLSLLVRPSNERPWAVDQALLPVAEFDGPLVTIRNIRNFRYETTDRYTPAYYDKTFDLRKLDSAWFIVEPFGKSSAAHTFVSFGFGPSEFVAVSVEIRKEKGESFSALKGLMRQYEVMYVVGDERDLIKLRTHYRKDPVYLYPMRTSRERMREMFTGMLERANKLRNQPEFYNTLTNTCTTNLVRHVNTMVPGRIPWHPAVFLPGYSDRLAYKLGLIETDLPLSEVRKRFRINELAEKHAEDPEFSQRIRGW